MDTMDEFVKGGDCACGAKENISSELPRGGRSEGTLALLSVEGCWIASNNFSAKGRRDWMYSFTGGEEVDGEEDEEEDVCGRVGVDDGGCALLLLGVAACKASTPRFIASMIHQTHCSISSAPPVAT